MFYTIRLIQHASDIVDTILINLLPVIIESSQKKILCVILQYYPLSICPFNFELREFTKNPPI